VASISGAEKGVPSARRFAGAIGFGILLAVAVGLLAILVFRDFQQHRSVRLTTPFQAVLLTNGEAYYGRLDGAASDYPVLTDVYYVQRRINPETKQTAGVLVKRGKEWHSPDRMVLNKNHIVLIEPVSPDSELGKAIAKMQER
jgi:hypothetical protein